MSQPARVAGVALCALVLLAVTACGPAPSSADRPRVLVVGDSIVLGARDALVRALDDRGWEAVVDARVSRPTSEGAAALASLAPQPGDVVVVALGANDAGALSAFRRRAGDVLDAARPASRVHWMTIREVRPVYGPANDVIREVTAARPDAAVIDWHAASEGSAGLTAADGLHLTASGASAMARLVADAVGSAASPAVASTPAASPPATPPPTAPSSTTPSSTTVAARSAPATTTTTPRSPTTSTTRPRPPAADPFTSERAAASVPRAPSEGSDGVAARVMVTVALLLAAGLASRRIQLSQHQKT